MTLPNPEQAVVELAKLRDYCLNPDHPRGRHKARVFGAALGLSADDADSLREVLLTVVLDHDATPTEQDSYGQRFVADFRMEGPTGPVGVRSSWIIRVGEDFPRLTSCYVL